MKEEFIFKKWYLDFYVVEGAVVLWGLNAMPGIKIWSADEK